MVLVAFWPGGKTRGLTPVALRATLRSEPSRRFYRARRYSANVSVRRSLNSSSPRSTRGARRSVVREREGWGCKGEREHSRGLASPPPRRRAGPGRRPAPTKPASRTAAISGPGWRSVPALGQEPLDRTSSEIAPRRTTHARSAFLMHRRATPRSGCRSTAPGFDLDRPTRRARASPPTRTWRKSQSPPGHRPAGRPGRRSSLGVSAPLR